MLTCSTYQVLLVIPDPVGIAPVLEVPDTSEEGPVAVVVREPVPEGIGPLLEAVMLPAEVELDQVKEECVEPALELPTSLDGTVIDEAVPTSLLDVLLP